MLEERRVRRVGDCVGAAEALEAHAPALKAALGDRLPLEQEDVLVAGIPADPVIRLIDCRRRALEDLQEAAIGVEQHAADLARRIVARRSFENALEFAGFHLMFRVADVDKSDQTHFLPNLARASGNN